MGYRNVWEILIKTKEGNTIQRYVGKSGKVKPFIGWLRTLDYVREVTSRKLSDQERKAIPMNMIIG